MTNGDRCTVRTELEYLNVAGHYNNDCLTEFDETWCSHAWVYIYIFTWLCMHECMGIYACMYACIGMFWKYLITSEIQPKLRSLDKVICYFPYGSVINISIVYLYPLESGWVVYSPENGYNFPYPRLF